jgi:tyrosyl-tRNA synthetase
LAGAIPTTTIDLGDYPLGLTMLEALVLCGAQPSKGAARRLIQQGGLHVNETRWTAPEQPLAREDALFGRAILLRAGKNKYSLLLVG